MAAVAKLIDRYDWEASVRWLDRCRFDSLSDEQLIGLHRELTYYLDYLVLEEPAIAASLLRHEATLYKAIQERPKLRRMGLVRQYPNKLRRILEGRDPEARRGRRSGSALGNDVIKALSAGHPKRKIARALQEYGSADDGALTVAKRPPGPRRKSRASADEPEFDPDKLEQKRRRVYDVAEAYEFTGRLSDVGLDWPIKRASPSPPKR